MMMVLPCVAMLTSACEYETAQRGTYLLNKRILQIDQRPPRDQARRDPRLSLLRILALYRDGGCRPRSGRRGRTTRATRRTARTAPKTPRSPRVPAPAPSPGLNRLLRAHHSLRRPMEIVISESIWIRHADLIIILLFPEPWRGQRFVSRKGDVHVRRRAEVASPGRRRGTEIPHSLPLSEDHLFFPALKGIQTRRSSQRWTRANRNASRR